jgi:hypothetical protein
MIFADMGENNTAPGVAPARNNRQASGQIDYGQRAGLLPALPPNFAAVDVNHGELPSGGGSGGGGQTPIRMPTRVALAVKSTLLPATMTSWTTIPVSQPSPPKIMTAPGPMPGTGYTPPGSPPPTGQYDNLFPGMLDVGTAADQGAEKVGAAAGAMATQPMSRGAQVGLFAVVGLLAVGGLYITMKHR